MQQFAGGSYMKHTLRLFVLLLAFVMALPVTISANAESTDASVAKALIEITFSTIDCDYDIHANSSGVLVRFSGEDYSYMYLMAQLFGNEETDKLMAEAAQETAKLCSTLQSQIESLGIKCPNLTLMLTDYNEKDYIFLIVYNGQIVYDILAD